MGLPVGFKLNASRFGALGLGFQGEAQGSTVSVQCYKLRMEDLEVRSWRVSWMYSSSVR